MLHAANLPLLAIVGPTATGKSRLAVHLAMELGGEVINADSRQVYRRMDIGTAKPSPEERGSVPHHLFDIADPAESFSLGVFLREARRIIADIHARGRLPIVAGGTGQYAWGLLEGWTVPEVEPQAAFREAMAAIASDAGPDALVARLASVDPASAAAIEPRNVRRVIRALEVHHVTGRPFSELRRREPPPWDVTVLGLDRSDGDLDERISGRVDAMLEAGFVDEVRQLLEAGVPRQASAMASIGYPQISACLAGECSLEAAREETIFATRRFVRRQRQWFRRTDARIRWVAGLDEALSASRMGV